MRRVPFLLVGLAVVSVTLPAQTPVTLGFEVASIRPVQQGDPRFLGRFGPPVNGIVRMPSGTFRRLMNYAYDIDVQLHDPPFEGGPAWIDKEMLSVQAKGPSELTLPEARLMLQALLRERFGLKTHSERREVHVYTLVLARADGRLGPGLKPSRVDCMAYSETLARTGRAALALEAGEKCGVVSGGRGGGLMVAGTAPIREIVRPLSRSPEVDRRIIDRTGLTGTYDISLEWMPARTGPTVAAPFNVVSVFTAIQEQLGLKLQPTKSSVDIIVIDHVERPTEN